MDLKYVGPKPIISHTGIEFDNNKEDKFVYLNIVLQLLKALNHEYIQDRTYIYDVNTRRLSPEEISHELKKYCSNIASIMDRTSHNIEDEINHNIERAHDNAILSEDDKSVLENNIKIMHDYLVQRSINKAVYYCAINTLADLLEKGHIDYIIVPMFQKFAHVLHSLQGSLERKNSDIKTKLDIYQEDGRLLVKLQIINK